ncbi:maelstrom -like protein [Brachionus plicatilis]|uniref:Maelstrom-like protein n=1 Tax=Brachionus plicatilis TaxID=10195 RepID=A0A3M7RTH3_BRAPC|nr:maelstrom -like protein [Brachionus plicatilis]
MPPKKNSRTALYYFVREKVEKGEASGNFHEAMGQVYEEWKSMSKKDKEPYEKKYKEFKESSRNEKMELTPASIKQEYLSETTSFNSRSTALVSQIINHFENLKKKGFAANKSAIDLVKEQKWYIVKFQTFCKCDENTLDNYEFSSNHYYVLAEVGAVEYSLENGITREFNAFIPPNKIPLGYRSLCMDSSKENQIPLSNFNKLNFTIPEIYAQLEEFLRPDETNNNFVPIFCMNKDLDETKFGLEFLEYETNALDTRCLYDKIFDLESLLIQLTGYFNVNLSYNSAREILTSYSFDYASNSRCKFHEEMGVHCGFCALGCVKKAAFLISEHIGPIFEINLTERHLPVQIPVGTVIHNTDSELRTKKSQRPFQYGKRPHENDQKSTTEIYMTQRTSNSGSSSMISVDIQKQSQNIRTNRRLVALETASEIDTNSVVSDKYEPDAEGWTVVKDKHQKATDNMSELSADNSNLSESTFKTVNPSRYIGRGRAFNKN